MDSSRLLEKALLTFSLASAVATVILFNITGSGLLAAWMVTTFMLGCFTSLVALVISMFRSRSGRQAIWIRTVFGLYVLAASLVWLWLVVYDPPFS